MLHLNQAGVESSTMREVSIAGAPLATFQVLHVADQQILIKVSTNEQTLLTMFTVQQSCSDGRRPERNAIVDRTVLAKT
jgi:hypothetical protein